MPEEYTIDFEVYGASLPIDEILAASPPASEFESWKAGQALTKARLAKTSGIRIAIAKRSGKVAAEEALARFFDEHGGFLQRLRGFKTAEDSQFVRCILCVYADNASYLDLPERVLRGLFSTGTEFVVAAWPCSSAGSPAGE